MVGYDAIPQWLDVLLKEKFFVPCLVHDDDKKTDKNIFCFDCSSTLCSHCVFRHRKHLLLQVRRYVYNDVLKLVDAQKLLDCSGVQPYISNGSKVVFLRQRPMSRLNSNSINSCFTCNRNLQDRFIFCSLSCKVQHIISTQGKLKINLWNQQMLSFSISDIDEDESPLTPNSVLDSAGSTTTNDLRTDLLCTATTEIVKKKRSNLTQSPNHGSSRSGVSHEPTGPTLNRRKGVPNRSPLY